MLIEPKGEIKFITSIDVTWCRIFVSHNNGDVINQEAVDNNIDKEKNNI